MRLVPKRTGETAQIMDIIQKINFFVIERLKTSLSSFIPRIQKKPAGLRPQQTIEIVFVNAPPVASIRKMTLSGKIYYFCSLK